GWAISVPNGVCHRKRWSAIGGALHSFFIFLPSTRAGLRPSNKLPNSRPPTFALSLHLDAAKGQGIVRSCARLQVSGRLRVSSSARGKVKLPHSAPCARPSFQGACRSRYRCQRPCRLPTSMFARARSARHGFSHATPRYSLCFMALVCVYLRRSVSNAVTFVPVPTPSLFWAKETRLGWCRYCLKSRKRSQTTSRFARTSLHRRRHYSLENAVDPFHPASCNWRWPNCKVRSDCQRPRHHTRCVIPSPH